VQLTVVSNRLPFVLSRAEDGTWAVEPGSGGLVSALRPVLRNRGGRWIGWSGVTDEERPDPATFRDSLGDYGYQLVPVPLTAAERDEFYYGFSNEVIWPLFHDMLSLCRFKPSYWVAYETVNRRFAEVAAQHAHHDDFLWVHDYHLITVARELRELGVRSRIAFFLHIPFPPLDLFLTLPWRYQLLRAMLEYDLIGLQTVRDRRNFLQCVRLMLGDAEIAGRGDVRTVAVEGREIRVGSFPISIDVKDIERRAAETEVVDITRTLKAAQPGRKIVLGVDRLDYTKGIPQKLEAFRSLLQRFPEWHRRVTLFQVLVPSREDIPGYHDQKTQIERLVGEINGQFTRSGWVPIHYLYRSLEPAPLLAYYRAADVALVTPLKDGMNLVAKEYCAARTDEAGVLLLSEFAGAAAQLQRGAFLVNPFDTDGVADALARALALPPEVQTTRMRRLRRTIREHDIYRWLDEFLAAAISKELADFPVREEYVPQATVR
jgi:trehalose 6-phosphate synthase/phosphatase